MDKRIQYWQRNPLSGEIPWCSAVSSLAWAEPRVVFRPTEGNTKWTLCIPGTDEPAVFCHAARLAFSTPIETGNYVNANCDPIGAYLPTYPIQRAPNDKCNISLWIQTKDDQSLWTLGRRAEMVLQSMDDFKKEVQSKDCLLFPSRRRHSWQDPTKPNNSFNMTSPVFIANSPFDLASVKNLDYPLHPWVEIACERYKGFSPNPNRVKFFDLVNDTVVNLYSDSQPTLFYGDVIWFSFTFSVSIGAEQWAPDYSLVNVVRVGRKAPHHWGIDNINDIPVRPITIPKRAKESNKPPFFPKPKAFPSAPPVPKETPGLHRLFTTPSTDADFPTWLVVPDLNSTTVPLKTIQEVEKERNLDDDRSASAAVPSSGRFFPASTAALPNEDDEIVLAPSTSARTNAHMPSRPTFEAFSFLGGLADALPATTNIDVGISGGSSRSRILRAEDKENRQM